ncbi:GIY-YIG nuclease family protein [Microbacterium sp. ABRD28]|uniref:GIY-YIG nuclease family protein n=1 Tax=Microbacterium sp. ABRD28 TaxID=2268461 RepID=UPI000F55712A|nr:GIY-YIG nuclease family protein [Microbacterium sp. ABRD28]AZC12764.1 GIY-YIG nuclease family protein [Microbacterium sp. ABRD28]
MDILECSDRSTYAGSTRDLKRRVTQHNEEMGALYTRAPLLLRLLSVEEFENAADAFRRETQVQGWGRTKLSRLFVDDSSNGTD